MTQQDSSQPQGSQDNFQMIQDDGTHTGLSSRFEDEIAKEAGRAEKPSVGEPQESSGGDEGRR